jgi:hypothetical protein
MSEETELPEIQAGPPNAWSSPESVPNDVILAIVGGKQYAHIKYAVVAKYLHENQFPHSEVLSALARCLADTGTNNWQLRFRVRNGRPPPRSAQPFGCDESAAIEAISNGHEQPLARYLQSVAQGPARISDAVREALAACFVTPSSGKWRLVFVRPQRGNPTTSRKQWLRQYVLGQRASNVYEQIEDAGQKATWQKVHDKLSTDGIYNGDRSKLMAAVALYKKSKKGSH